MHKLILNNSRENKNKNKKYYYTKILSRKTRNFLSFGYGLNFAPKILVALDFYTIEVGSTSIAIVIL